MAQLPKDFLVSGALISPMPGVFWIAGGNWRWEKSPSLSQLSFFAPDFFLTQSNAWAIPSEWAQVSAPELVEMLLAQKESCDEDEPTQWIEPDRADFERVFEDLKRQIEPGILHKAVPIVFARSEREMSRSLLIRLLLSLLQNLSLMDKECSERALRIYGIWNHSGNTPHAFSGILGATPEDLFEITPEGNVLTMALAGTRAKATQPQSDAALSAIKEEFLKDPKEIREHQWVIDDIREALLGLGELKIHETQVLELPLLLHLKTRIELKSPSLVPEALWAELVQRLHPTAALGAFPRGEGWKWLQIQDLHQKRHRFGAPFGAFWPKKGAICSVAIRNVQWSAGELRLGAGCGVIQESTLDREWRELAMKRESVKRLLGT